MKIMSKFNFGSYPPLFRPDPSDLTQNPLNPDHNLTDPAHCSDTLPVLDMNSLDLESLDKACKDWGIFRLVNHGVPIELLTQIQEHAKRVFELGFESKHALFKGTPMAYFWGTPALTSSGAALSRGPQNVDWVEGVNVPLAHLHGQDQAEDPLVSEFRKLMEEYGGHLSRVAKAIFEAMAKSLQLNLNFVNGYLDESTGLIRVYRYPKYEYTGQKGHMRGMHVHTDSSVVSILSQDEVGGLEFLKDGAWVHVKPIPDTLIVNLGDMMQAISNDKYKSVKHRVTLNKHKERISICYFVFPEENKVIKSSKYKPFTYSEFRAIVQEDVKTLGYKVGLDRFRA